MKVLNIDYPNITDAQMRAISAKTMVIVDDADAVEDAPPANPSLW